jgi:cellulose synthase operon protein C
MKFLPKKWQRWTVALLATMMFLAGGYVVARKYAWPTVKGWRVQRMNAVAREFLAKDDPANALLSARKTLQASQDNVEAWRIAVAASKKRDDPDVTFYQQNLAQRDPTKENYLELMRLGLKYNRYPYVGEGIKAIAKRANDDPEFHSLAAQTYLRTGKTLPAKYHLLALTQLRPTDRVAQLDLAEIEIAADPDRKDRALRARVRGLADDPALRVRALVLLLRESVKANLRVETGELMTRLQAVPDLGVNERLLLLEAAGIVGGNTLTTLNLDKLQSEVADKPQEVIRVVEYLARTGQHERTIAWYAALPEETKKDEDVKRVTADALLARGDWSALESHLKTGSWPTREFYRQALLAYAYKNQARPAEFAEAWKAAIVAVGTDPNVAGNKAKILLAKAEQWKWVHERYDVVWKLFSLNPANLPVRQALLIWEKQQGNTANLNKLFARVIDIEPRDQMARNNFAYTSLLLDANLSRAALIAAEHYAARPDDPFIVTTYAFSLFKQGKAAEALAKLETLSAAELSEPDRMLHRAVFLARVGEISRATEIMKGIDQRRLLPEERRLIENAKIEIARRERTQVDETRLTAIKQAQGAEGGANGWLALVLAPTREAATVEMQLADSLYAAADWTALHTMLRSKDWKSEEYLRLALLSYVGRMRDDNLQTREYWRQALAATNREVTRAQNLEALATAWKWPAERIEAVNVLYERNSRDEALLKELLTYYREAKRTRELVRVLTLNVSRTSDTTAEAVALAYYSLLTDVNAARAHVVAKDAYDAAPEDGSRRLVHAFSLWKQKRTAEANALVTGLNGVTTSELVPVALLRAGIQADLGLLEEANSNLKAFNTDTALPEEAALASKIAAQLAKAAESK